MPNQPNLWEQFTGKRNRDINLPSEGKLDSRLNTSGDKVKAITNNSALQALKNYGLAAAKKAK